MMLKTALWERFLSKTLTRTDAPDTARGEPAKLRGEAAQAPLLSATERYVESSLKLAESRLAALRSLEVGETWEGWRDFTIARRVEETGDQISFYLEPQDGGPLPRYKPGQYLTFKVAIDGKDEIRCYSLSGSPDESSYRVTIKRAQAPKDAPDAPAGKVSSYFQDELRVGASVQAKAPAGSFVLDLAEQKPAILVGGGVGVTPFISMLSTLAAQKSERPVHLFYAATTPADFMMRAQLEELAAEHENIKVTFVASQPRANDQAGVDYHHKGHVSLELLRAHLPKDEPFEIYMCGPPAMMSTLTEGFRKAGVHDRYLHSEAFGPAAKPKDMPTRAELARGVADAPPAELFFVKSGVALKVNPGDGQTVLEAAEKAGVNIPWMCRQGSCKGCACSLRKGKVAYPDGDPGAPAGKILPCVAVALAGELIEIEEPR